MPRKLLATIAIIVFVILLFKLGTNTLNDTNSDTPKTKPNITFDHSKHAKIDCRVCHNAENKPMIKTKEECIGCHTTNK